MGVISTALFEVVRALSLVAELLTRLPSIIFNALGG